MRPNAFNPVVSCVMVDVFVAHVPRLQNESGAATSAVTVNKNFTTFAKERIDGVNSIFHDGEQVSIAIVVIDEVELASIGEMF